MQRKKDIFIGTIKAGKYYFGDRIAFDNHVAAQPDGEYQLTMEKKKRLRTSGQDWEDSNQNGYYWGVVIPKFQQYFASIGTPMDKDQIHDGIKLMFLYDGLLSGFPHIKSSTGLEPGEWEELMRLIRDYAMENYNLYIPEPNEN